ncbi:signal peptidase type I [[Clostridium] sordellii]|uniref:signal peptidase I n=1 Tax=Paraclostridium sordellii TaxID=1505 RepID=UPI0005DE0658|nr:signal peptidase I [Paeniclostridium sordellii]MBX9182896.1 signal peptidase I [Paeniclostridium sordellii]MDU1455705.1 signal peptidase I [Paeniclostridium sordellii]CEO12293.1 signal peptidase type I [[Clostridium] sordellii] [Paeniclostridium sordellii]CEP85821.1 signal peptidase type I [[Clostridium] sordellii] [Paeniclostridium sordellii]CEQ19362.1 signal peptidase type I [[Clostridium] sordellii] [Paeniclostridium sordellii]
MGEEKVLVNKFDKFKILNIAVTGVIILLVLNLITTKSDKLFKLIGFRTYTVLSGSMEPEFYPGDMVITKHKDKVNINVNDIVTYRDNEGVIITHRIIEETDEGYITKGDNNNVKDAGILKEENIIGKVKFSIPKIGYVMNFLSDSKVVAIEMVILAIFIFFYYKD